MNRARNSRELDPIDLQLLHLLAIDGRQSNKELAAATGIAPSTCLTRVRRLQRDGVIKAVQAIIDPVKLGYPLQAIIAVRVRADARRHLEEFSRRICASEIVMGVTFVSGSYDFLIQVAAENTAALRQFIVQELNSLPMVANTETHLVFERLQGSFPGPPPQRRSERCPGGNLT